MPPSSSRFVVCLPNADAPLSTTVLPYSSGPMMTVFFTAITPAATPKTNSLPSSVEVSRALAAGRNINPPLTFQAMKSLITPPTMSDGIPRTLPSLV